MAREFYRAPYQGQVTAAGGDTDLMILEPGDDKPIRLAGFSIGQVSEVGDAAEENLRITVRHMTATVTKTGGTGVTPVGVHPGTSPSSGTTATANCTTVATTSGTSTIMHEYAWNVRATPWEVWIPEEVRPYAKQGEALIIRLETTLADNIDNLQITPIFEEG